ncbi:transposase family protein [Streptomyces sp. NPDC008343]|uniref:transposase family protein n=1 Tax=Streptomyces sp. NPDC008343 TaxID=3364828 RepID=UPI0036EA85CD
MVVRVEALSTARQAICPGCECPSGRLHGSYLRFPHDLPAAGNSVVVALRVRRFVCAEASCPPVRARLSPSRCRDSPTGSAGGRNGCDRRSSRSASRSRAGPGLA